MEVGFSSNQTEVTISIVFSFQLLLNLNNFCVLCIGVLFILTIINYYARKLSYNFPCKILARFFVSCKKSFILVQDLASLARTILARFAYFLQDRFYLGTNTSVFLS